MANSKGESVMDEREELQTTLYYALEELLFFLKQCSMRGSFKNDSVKDIIKLGLGRKRPQVDSYIMPMATSCLPMLFAFLAEGALHTLEDHLLCADAAAALLSMFPASQATVLASHCLHVGSEPKSVVDFSQGKTGVYLKLTVAKPCSFKLCISRGLLRVQHGLTPKLMVSMTLPITTACYQYSHLTCLGFRTLHMWLSLWKKMDYCLDDTVSRNIYTIIADNWENQVPGVRKESIKVLGALLDGTCATSKFTAERMLLHVMTDISSRMKSKYFLLAILLPKLGVLKVLKEYPCLVPLLVATLGVTYLTSAGADVYRVCLAAFPDVDSWCHCFLQPLLALFTSQREQHRLAQLNLLSRWLTPTLRQFPALTHILYNHLMSVQNKNTQVDVALSALMHQGRKEGYLAELWPEYSFIGRYLVHGDEEVRKNVFAAVCKRTKKAAVPQVEEFDAVKKYLKENISVDSGTLRQSTVDSFFHFLERLFESSVKLMGNKVEEEWSQLKPTFTFLNWTHEFLLGNLKLGSNYQRIVTSLQLYLEVLKRFGPRDVKSSPAAEGLRVLGHAHGLWGFESHESWLTLLECVHNPTEDVQKVAAEILANHLKLLDEESALKRAEQLWKLTLRQCNSALFYEAESGSHLMKLLVQFIQESPHLSQVIPIEPNVEKSGENLDVLLVAFKDFSVGLESDSSNASVCDELNCVTNSHEVQNDCPMQRTDESSLSVNQSACVNLTESTSDFKRRLGRSLIRKDYYYYYSRNGTKFQPYGEINVIIVVVIL